MTAIRTGVAAAARCLALDQLAAEVITALDRAGIDVVLLKGAGLAQRLYPDNPDGRRYSDVDLLVAPDTFDRAQQVLAGLGLQDCLRGLRTDEMHWHERLWRQPEPSSLGVDLHRGFAGVGDAKAFWEIISATTEPLQLSGADIRVPGAAGCALVVGLHAARPGLGRKALTDLVVAMALLPDQVWTDAADVARQSGSTRAFARGLRRDPTGATLCERLDLRAGGTLAEVLVARGVYGAARNLALLSDLPGLRAKMRHIAGRLAPSAAFMRYSQPLARRGIAGLAVSYLLRLGRIAREAPGAVVVVCRAKRAQRPPRRKVLARYSSVLKATAGLDGADRLTGLWTLLTLHRTRRQLALAPLADLNLTAPPAAGQAGMRTVDRVLAHRSANCMEIALVMQRWLAGQGIARDLLIGVTAPGDRFRAHAWLDHPDGVDDPELKEIHRRPPPPAWLTTGRRPSRLQRIARD